MSAAVLDDPLALTDGAWVQRHGIHVWRWGRSATPTPPAELIACPRCHACLTEPCLSRTGVRTDSHRVRLVARLCPCLGHRYSSPCPLRRAA